MRYSILLLASSVALRVSDNPVAEATGAAVYDTNQDRTLHEITNIIRPQRLLRSSNTTVDEERMNSALQSFRLLFKSHDQILEELGVGLTTGTGSHAENVETIVKTMEHKDMGLMLKVFKLKRLVKKDAFLVNSLFHRWSLDDVAAALGRAKASHDKTVRANGQKLHNELMKSLYNQAGGDYQEALKQLLLKAGSTNPQNSNWRAFELLEEYIKYKSNRQPHDQLLFDTLNEWYGNVYSIVLAIDRAKTDEGTAKKAEAFETRFVKYFVDKKETRDSFFVRLDLRSLGYKMFKDTRFEMMKQFLVLEGVDKTKIPQQMLKLLITGFGGKEELAISLSKGVADHDFKEESEVYEMLLFQHLKRENIDPDKVFTSGELASDPALTFKKRYKDWYDQISKETPI